MAGQAQNTTELMHLGKPGPGEVVDKHSSLLASWVRMTLDCSMQSLRGRIPWKPLKVHKLTPLY